MIEALFPLKFHVVTQRDASKGSEFLFLSVIEDKKAGKGHSKTIRMAFEHMNDVQNRKAIVPIII